MSRETFSSRRFALAAATVIAVFLTAGGAAADLIAHHGAMHGTPPAEVRMAAWMGGLFVGGASATVVALVLAFGKRRA